MWAAAVRFLCGLGAEMPKRVRDTTTTNPREENMGNGHLLIVAANCQQLDPFWTRSGDEKSHVGSGPTALSRILLSYLLPAPVVKGGIKDNLYFPKD